MQTLVPALMRDVHAACDLADASEITEQEPGMYKDLCWADPSPVLFCGGTSTKLDLYNLA